MNALQEFYIEQGQPAPILPQAALDIEFRSLSRIIRELADCADGYDEEAKEERKLSSRKRRGRIQDLMDAIDALTEADRDSLARWLPFDGDMKLQEHPTEEADGHLQALRHAALDVLACTPNTRRAGYVATLRRRLVRQAARVYLAMGFDTLGAGKDTPFDEFIKKAGDWTGRAGSELFIGEFKRAIEDEFGKTATERKATADEIRLRLKHKYRHYFEE
jgi:hypothetical protein